jgi:hypothetical protein
MSAAVVGVGSDFGLSMSSLTRDGTTT